MLRFFDCVLASIGLFMAIPLMVVISLVAFCDTGSPILFQKRLGREQKLFTLIKFRTMKKSAAVVPTHEVDPSVVTAFGRFLRSTKLDELPQLINVLRGDMSLVGPRPCLPTQAKLIMERESRLVFSVRPGITGYAQVLRIDMSSPELLAEIDAKMIESLTVFTYWKYIFLTACGAGFGDHTKP
jgi:O-antigen biosynthesis protein WbqP